MFDGNHYCSKNIFVCFPPSFDEEVMQTDLGRGSETEFPHKLKHLFEQTRKFSDIVKHLLIA